MLFIWIISAWISQWVSHFLLATNWLMVACDWPGWISWKSKRGHRKEIQWNPDFSNPWFLETLDISNQTLFPLDLFHLSSMISPLISRPLDFLKLPITRTNFFPVRHIDPRSLEPAKISKQLSGDVNYIHALTLPDKLFSPILITQQASHKSFISLKGTMTASEFPYLIVFLELLPQYIDKFRCPLEIEWALYTETTTCVLLCSVLFVNKGQELH